MHFSGLIGFTAHGSRAVVAQTEGSQQGAAKLTHGGRIWSYECGSHVQDIDYQIGR